MNTQQHTQYTSIKEGYKTEPRWVAAREVMADPAANAEEYAFAVSEAAKYERYAAKAAEAARLGGI
jgi:hypothetical protein